MVHASLLLLAAAASSALAKVDKLNDAAFKEAQQRDDTATRAASNAQITTSDGKCLFIDKLGGDFRANLAPVQIVDCGSQADGLGFDVITAGKHNDQKGQALVVSTSTQACLNFDDRRQPGDQVIMFSCGGRADGEGKVTNSQLFAFDGKTQSIQMKPENGNGKCLVATGARVSIAQCDANDKNQQFTIGGNGAVNTGKGGVANNSTQTQSKDDTKTQSQTQNEQKTKTKNNNKTKGQKSKTMDQNSKTKDQSSQTTALASQTQDACSGKLQTVYNYITVTMEVSEGGETTVVAPPASSSEVIVKEMTTQTTVESAAATSAAGMNESKDMSKETKAQNSMGRKSRTKDMSKETKTRGGQAQSTLIKQTKDRNTKTKDTASKETQVAQASTTAQSNITTTASSASSQSTNTGIPVPVARGGFIDSDAADKAHQEDATATVQDGFRAVHIKTSANKCLEFDTLQGDSLQNLLPLNIVDCRSQASFQKFDMSFYSKKNNDARAAKALVIGSEFPSCLMFDGTRAKDDQVNMFSCGGIATGSGKQTLNFKHMIYKLLTAR